ncbi:MAG: aromatic-L-amino-acid/L-tryptophan decarboxylase [Solirubrobacteraceae bacterium]|jgi:glutamate/tyrosine decarboxylase-like PLP-dependent enzyme|nr:aromatic-L-amino-acid/L-tryptophan decarboxylase [Solirubrobacteraceae bacterium]
MREIGYRTIDMLVDQLSDPAIPAMRRGVGDDLRRGLMAAPPEQPREWDELLRQLDHDVLTPMSRLSHPGYFAFIPASSTFAGALGDLIAAALDIDVGSWMSAAGPSQLELVVLDWFKSWIGYPPEAAGILVSGGSAANITALACARESLVGAGSDGVVAYAADQTHSSVARAARLLGFRPDQLRVLPTDDAHRLRVDALAGAIEADVQAGLQPLIVVANAGATNTGAVDPLVELAQLCREKGLWLHVDAAYGGFAALTERGRRELTGIELADSVTLDPHKWLYQPIECGSLLVREGHLLREAFAINPDYLADYKSDEVNFSDLGVQLTRGARALKIWLSINYFGLDAFRRAIDRSIDLAHAAELQVGQSPALELIAPASLGIICFRRRFDGVHEEDTIALLNAELVRAFEATGRGLVSSTRLDGRYAIRLCVMNHTSGPEDVEAALSWFARAPQPSRPAIASPRAHQDPTADLRGGWGDTSVFDVATVRRLPLFSALDDGALDVVVKSATEAWAETGEAIVTRWQGTRHFYTVVSGTAEVRNDTQVLREMGPGDYFGELAALDWGAGFGYARTAHVVATSPLRLLVLVPSALTELLKQAPDLDRRLRAAAREHVRSL